MQRGIHEGGKGSSTSHGSRLARGLLRIVAVDPLPERLRNLFFDQLDAESFHFQCPDTEDIDDLMEVVKGANALITRHRTVTAELIATAGEELRLVQVIGRLPDRVDLEAAGKAQVPVAVMPHRGAIAVAEHTLALMLALTRKLLPGHRGVAAGEYRQRALEPTVTSEWAHAFNWLGFQDVSELNGKTLGLVGLGEIGREVARRARAFEMTVIYHQRHQLSTQFEKQLDVQKIPLDELLRRADFVSLHAPHTPETHHMIDAGKLALLKPTTYLINTSRGGLVDEIALVESLRRRRIAGAGLDVFIREPLPADHPLLTLDNVVLSPHTGGGTGGGYRLHIRQVLENITRTIQGGKPLHLVGQAGLL